MTYDPTPPPTTARDEALPRTTIAARAGRTSLDLRAVWTYRELVYFFVWRDLKVRYRQTLLGLMWAVLQPVVTMIVFTVVFGHLADMESDGIPYPLFALAALLPWTFFASAVNQAANSLVGNQNLLKKVYFPRLVIPLSVVLTGLVDLAVAATVLAAMMAYYGVVPGPEALLLLPLVLLALLTALSLGLWLSALNVRYRDVRYVVPFALQVGLFLTPVAYPSSVIDEPWRSLSALNPMVGVVEGVRWALLGTDTAPGRLVLVSTASMLVVLVSGAWFFRRVEGSFADVI